MIVELGLLINEVSTTALDKQTMATSGTNFLCGVCHHQDFTELATYWCPQCEDGLCDACKQFHESLKLTRHHSVITIEDHKQLPTSLLAGKYTCVEHEMPLDLYCKKHDQPCCPSCLNEKHANCACEDIDSFTNVVKNIKSSAKFESVEKKASNLKLDFETLESHCKDTILHICKDVKTRKQELKDTRKSLTEYLDMLENRIEKSLSSGEEKAMTNFNNLLVDLHTKKEKIQRLQESLNNLKVYSTNHQTFFAVEEIEKEIMIQESYIMTLIESDVVSRPDFSLDFSNIGRVINQLTEFGLLEITRTPFESPLNVTKMNKAQLHVIGRNPKSIYDFKLNLKYMFSLKSQVCGNLVSGVIMSSGDLLLVSFYKKQLLSCKPNGSSLKTISTFHKSPVDVCLDEKTNSAAVGFIGATEAVVVDLETGKTTGLGENAYAVDYDQESYFGTNCSTKTLWWLDSKTCSNLKRVKLESALNYCKAFKDYFICSQYVNNCVSANDYEGEKLWDYTHENFKGPLGVTSASNGLIFVACRESNNIWLISSDGKDGIVLRSEEDGMEGPRGIHFNAERKELLVVCEYSPVVFLYAVD